MMDWNVGWWIVRYAHVETEDDYYARLDVPPRPRPRRAPHLSSAAAYAFDSTTTPATCGMPTPGPTKASARPCPPSARGTAARAPAPRGEARVGFGVGRGTGDVCPASYAGAVARAGAKKIAGGWRGGGSTVEVERDRSSTRATGHYTKRGAEGAPRAVRRASTKSTMISRRSPSHLPDADVETQRRTNSRKQPWRRGDCPEGAGGSRAAERGIRVGCGWAMSERIEDHMTGVGAPIRVHPRLCAPCSTLLADADAAHTDAVVHMETTPHAPHGSETYTPPPRPRRPTAGGEGGEGSTPRFGR
ncbi:hypothetical protein C8R45DRAFT_569820 [Mycena sanguinolenta]|nr:hypothetical protein C8R45DRAFT_569820 [Mycena sanguinolenta]